MLKETNKFLIFKNDVKRMIDSWKEAEGYLEDNHGNMEPMDGDAIEEFINMIQNIADAYQGNMSDEEIAEFEEQLVKKGWLKE